MTPKAIFFDLDETLVKNRMPVATLFTEVYKQYNDQLGADSQEPFFSALRANAKDLWGTMFESELSPEQQFIACFRHSINSLNRVSSKQAKSLAEGMFDSYKALSSANVVLHHDTLSTLLELRKKGFITGIITNGIEEIQLGKIAQLKLDDTVDHITVSAQARAHKPYAPVFDLAISRAGVAAHQAWQVGDHAINDVAGAIRFGMQGIFYNPDQKDVGAEFRELSESPSHTIASLSQVISLADA